MLKKTGLPLPFTHQVLSQDFHPPPRIQSRQICYPKALIRWWCCALLLFPCFLPKIGLSRPGFPIFIHVTFHKIRSSRALEAQTRYLRTLFGQTHVSILPEGQKCNSTLFQSVCEATFYASLITFQMSFQSLAKYNKWNRSRFPVNAPLYGFP